MVAIFDEIIYNKKKHKKQRGLIAMKPLFPTYLIKRRAKEAMRGKFFKAFAVVFTELLLVVLIGIGVYFLMPGMKRSFGLVLSGAFPSLEARQMYMSELMENYQMGTIVITLLFSFVSVGVIKQLLNLIRGREVRVRDVFCYYNKWYVALIYPMVSYLSGWLLSYLIFFAEKAGMSQIAVNFSAIAADVVLMIVSYKLIFLNYALADNDCSDFIGAVKKAWRMVGFNTAINFIWLGLSFLGWLLLSVVGIFLPLLYVLPYMSVATAVLYEMNKEHYEAQGEANVTDV